MNSFEPDDKSKRVELLATQTTTNMKRSKLPVVTVPKCKVVCKTCHHTEDWSNDVNELYRRALQNDASPLKRRLAQWLTDQNKPTIIKHYCEMTAKEEEWLRKVYSKTKESREALVDWLDETIGALVLNNTVIFLAFDMSAMEAAKRVVHEMFHIARIKTDASVEEYMKGNVTKEVKEREEMLAFYAQELLFCGSSDNQKALTIMLDTYTPLLEEVYELKLTLTANRLKTIMNKIVPSY